MYVFSFLYGKLNIHSNIRGKHTQRKDWSLIFTKTYANVYVFEKKKHTRYYDGRGVYIFAYVAYVERNRRRSSLIFFNFFFLWWGWWETDNILAPYGGRFLRILETKTYTKKGCMFVATYTSVFSKFSAYVADQYVISYIIIIKKL